MKYIRTKDNIFEVENEKPNSIIFCKPRHTKMLVEIDVNVYEMKNIIIMREIGKDHWKEEILKQADTIEELCDVIVCGNELFYPLTSNRAGNEFNWEEINRFRSSVCMSEEEYNKIKETTNDFEPYFWNVYGAIWTDKGLIYVAKMNDKGELELL